MSPWDSVADGSLMLEMAALPSLGERDASQSRARRAGPLRSQSRGGEDALSKRFGHVRRRFKAELTRPLRLFNGQCARQD